MPRGDGTGPMGMGAMSGRGAGYCAGFERLGRGSAGGFGFGRGLCRRFYATGRPGWSGYGYPAYPETERPAYDEKTSLSSQAKYLESQLQEIKKRLSDLDEEAK